MWKVFGVLAVAMMAAGLALLVLSPRERVVLDPSLTSGRAPTPTPTTLAPSPTTGSTTASSSTGSSSTSTTADGAEPTSTITTVVAPEFDEVTTTGAVPTVPVPSLNGGDRPREDAHPARARPGHSI